MKALGKIRRSERRYADALDRQIEHPGPYGAFDRKKLTRLLAAGHRWDMATNAWKPSKARASFTYRGMMGNLNRGTPKAILLKRERLEHGWTRRQYDYIRHCDRNDWPFSIKRIDELGAWT